MGSQRLHLLSELNLPPVIHKFIISTPPAKGEVLKGFKAASMLERTPKFVFLKHNQESQHLRWAKIKPESKFIGRIVRLDI